MTDPGGTHEYGYDDTYQLTSATYPTIPSETFGYDSVGNRTASHISPSYTYNAGNQLLEDAEFVYQYDADGNCTQKVSKLDGARHEYVFNSENRMTGYRKYDVSSTLLTTADYFYDAVGRRMAKQVDGNLTRYINREEDVVMVLPQASSPIFYWHGPGIDEPIASVAGDQGYFNDMGGYWTYYFLTDGLGSVREVRLHAPWQIGVLVLAPLYDSFGQILTSPPAPDSTLNLSLYTGRQLDAESGLYYLRARYYDPRTGRFVSEDPAMRTNAYPYADSNPINRVDPMGLFSVDPSCECYDEWGGRSGSPNSGSGGLASRIRGAVGEHCLWVDLEITDPALRECIKKSCEEGKVTCEGCTIPGAAGQGPQGTIENPQRLARYCPDNWKYPIVNDVSLGDIAIHEWAHGCGWHHCEGKGVPRQECDNPLGGGK